MPSQSATYAVLSSTAATDVEVQVEAGEGCRLVELLSLVPDPRCARGVRHAVAGLLGVAAAAVLAGARSVLAIGEWAAEAPQGVLAALGARFCRRRGRCVAAHVDTFRRVLKAVDADAVDTAVGLFLAERAGAGDLFDSASPADTQPDPDPEAGSGSGSGAGPEVESGPKVEVAADQTVAIGVHVGQLPAGAASADRRPAAGVLAVDGKQSRGAVQLDGRAVHLLSAMVHGQSVVVAQRDVAHKTNEITQVKPLLMPLNLAGWVVTLDAMHAQQETARFLVEDKQAAYVFCAVKDNQPKAFAALDALDWHHTPVAYQRWERGHGRLESRTIRVLPAPPGVFPYAAQAFLIERYVYDPHDATRMLSAAATLGITCLSAHQADPKQLAGYVRGHWGIESLHWIRDVTFDEDRHQLRKGSAPQVIAGLRNLAIGALRTAGRTKIAASLRWVSRNPIRALHILTQPA